MAAGVVVSAKGGAVHQCRADIRRGLVAMRDEVVTVDLPAGNWAMVCFLPAPDGTPHAFKGMAVPFTVA